MKVNAVLWFRVDDPEKGFMGRREFQALNLAVNPTFATMRNTPGFHALKKRIGLER